MNKDDIVDLLNAAGTQIRAGKSLVDVMDSVKDSVMSTNFGVPSQPDQVKPPDDLADAPVEDIEIKKQPAVPTPKVGSDEFCEALRKEFSEGKIWRSSKALGEKLNVDVVELAGFLEKQQLVCTRRSKEEGVFLYALVSRLGEAAKDENAEKVKEQLRPLVSEEDRYAIASKR